MTHPSQALAERLVLVGAGLLFAVSVLLAHLEVEPFATWLYPLAWWSLVVAVDQAVRWRKGESLLSMGWSNVTFLLGASVVFWMLFELANLRLENWYYVNAPRTFVLRAAAELASFATVLPAVFVVAELMDAYGLFVSPPPPAVRVTPRVETILMGAGALAVALALALPGHLYPLLWLGPLAVMEGYLHRQGIPSLLHDFETGNVRRINLLLASGLLSGLLWEWLNWEARAHWFYVIPGFGAPRYFRMPWAGMLGFLPFALTAYSFWILVDQLRGGGGWRLAEWPAEREQRLARAVTPSRALVPAVGVAIVVVAAGLAGVDRFTVDSIRPVADDVGALLADRPDLAEEWREDRKVLAAFGLEDPFELFSRAHGYRAATLTMDEGVPPSALEPGVTVAGMLVVAGLGRRNSQMLRDAGFESIDVLAKVPAERVAGRLRDAAARSGQRPPSSGKVTNWIEEARRVAGLR